MVFCMKACGHYGGGLFCCHQLVRHYTAPCRVTKEGQMPEHLPLVPASHPDYGVRLVQAASPLFCGCSGLNVSAVGVRNTTSFP